jgi:cytochrome c oxidase subunit 2
VRRGSIVQLVLISAVAAAVAAAVALVPDWLPRQASDEAGRIDFVFWFVTAICIGIFALVAGVTIFSIWKFRVRPDDDSDGPPIHGHTGLEIAWTAVPTALVTAIAVVSAVVLAKNGEAGDNPLRVNVLAQQFAWSFTYPEQGNLTSGTLRLPRGRSVELHLNARDVIHSFWVPEFGQKQDAVPGIETRLVITPKRLGTFPVICTELCGVGHAIMLTQAIVMEPEAFEAWARQRGQAAQGPPGEAGKAVFEENGCGSCHTFTPAGAKGTIGPDLDELPALAQRAGKPLDEFVRESIENPGAYVEPGFRNQMPPFQLSDEELDALVQYLTRGASR